MIRIALRVLIAASLTAIVGETACAQEKDAALGAMRPLNYQPLYVNTFENFSDSDGSSGRQRRCVSEARRVVLKHREQKDSVTVVFDTEELAFFKVITRSGQKLIVHCNQNGALVVGWIPDTEVSDFVQNTQSIGITLQEKAIDNQKQPPAIINIVPGATK